MIVSCPSCNAKYRVRDEAVPQGGAELECPECGSHFLAHPPSLDELHQAIDKLTDAKAVLDARVEELAKKLAQKESDLEGIVAQRDAALEQKDRQLAEVRMETQRHQSGLNDELARLRTEITSRSSAETALSAEIGRLRAEAESVVGLRNELTASRSEVEALRQKVQEAGRAYGELELLRQRVKMLESAPSGSGNAGDAARVVELEREVETLRRQLADTMNTAGTSEPTTTEVAAMVAGMGPMVWGLEKAIEYLEPFVADAPDLAAHVRQLRLLAAVIKRLTAEAA